MITIRILLLSFLTLGFVGPARAQGTAGNQADAEIEKEVLKVEHQKDEALRNRDVAVLDQIYADDLAFVNARGKVITKAEHLDEIRSGQINYLSREQEDYRVHVWGDTVVLTGREKSVLEYHGKVTRLPRQFTTVYIKRNGKWRYVAHQVSPVVDQ